MAEVAQPLLDGPIPGMSLTAELGSRPWQSPPQYATVDDAVEYYLSRMSSEEFSEQLIDVMEMGIPLTTIANTIQMASVMEGKHTIDVGILVLPVIVELMSLMAENAGIKYTTGVERKSSNGYSSSEIALAVKKAGDKFNDQDMSEDMMTEESEPVMEGEQPTGLMARRV
mgnify:CR=1 FL=1